jgi:hypothetical protein
MEAISFSKTSVDFQRIRELYTTEDRTFLQVQQNGDFLVNWNKQTT